ncbi:MAG: DUF1592 domain-containing protein [Thalassotalea sp.]
MKSETIKPYFFIVSLLSVVLAGGVLAIVTILSPLDGVSGEGVLRFFGRFHPLVLHFPITLLVLALGFELLRFLSKPWARWSAIGLPLLVLAVITACITATLGVLLAANEGHMGALVERHRLLGISVAVLAILALGLRWLSAKVKSKQSSLRLTSLATLSLTCFVMMIAAHDGGSMVHGASYLSQYAPAPLKSLLTPSSVVKHSPDEAKSLSSAKSPNSEKLNTEILNTYHHDIAPILERNCSSCHGDSKQKAGIRFDQLSPAMETDHEVELWSSVRDALNSHQMPPKEEGRQPSSADRQKIVNWIGTAFNQVAKQRLDKRVSPMRRLTVNEYQHTLQDLFSTEFTFGANLPSAPISEHGYSRDAKLVSVSALELEYFLDIARESVENYVIFGERLPEIEHFLIEFEDVKYRPGVDGGYSVDKPLTAQALAKKRQAREPNPVVYSPRTLFPLPDGPALASTLLQRSVLQKFNGQYAKFKSNQPHQAGEMIVRVHAAAKKGDDGSVPRLRFISGNPESAGFKGPIAGECDVTATVDNPQICTFRLPLRSLPVDFGEKGKLLQFFVFNVSHDPDAIFDIVPEGLNFHPKRRGLMSRYRKSQAKAIISKATMREAGVNELYLDAIEIDIVPFGADIENSVNAFRIDALRANQNGGINAREVAQESLQEFMTRAYRRSISASELNSMLALYDQFINEGDSFEGALKETFSTVLVSAPFLYVVAPLAQEVAEQISEEERIQFAARLSYFLWNGPPDERLRELAAQDKLRDPGLLAAEVNRMLADERSRRFSSNFAEEWLRLDKFDLVAVNPEFYPRYDQDLGNDMVKETIATFQDIFHNNKDSRELVASDTVYINQRLARHYGLPTVEGGEMRPVKVPDYRTRGGLLHQASILTMTADGAESNPIYRGVWVLERLLNDPPPPPPPAVPPLDTTADDFASLTLKQKIELHRKQSACSACHAKIDPWGIALENFDAIGAWRDASLIINANTSEQSFFPVDSSTVLPTGEEIQDSKELMSYLFNERADEFTHALTWHMMTYALGREPNLGDEKDLETIHSHFRASGYKLSALVLAIIQSEAFQANPAVNAKPKNKAKPNTLHTQIDTSQIK